MDDLLDEFEAGGPKAAPEDLFRRLEAMCRALVGVKLFTCSRFDLAAGVAERIYTSDEEAYPLTGLKEIVPNRWTGIVLDRREPFLATTIEELRDVFPDHEKIEALGLGAVINLPVHDRNRFLGTLNLLHRNGHYSEESLPPLRRVCGPAVIAFLSQVRPDE
ncbi:MAG: GAF domain-containing protein [Boseongicola sp. SB0676_bin_33]|uniref:GAF domain-containing protein n=1 Tax=Boseongicola sp. SB0664_bin_43 TaxID=2604844 RepID=A0A6B0Y2X7_9RHOB|nr:GAF domain-containing protein [Boseongicola sp. SB0664_bin_43]MYF90253.1 GAF domain-containing protein [Boseongicola sp. SB0676_bin_33]MYK30329.1 GAF domain-containing protein [Boseongicola sp. SB0670_bin_30]